jgi:predicted esterase
MWSVDVCIGGKTHAVALSQAANGTLWATSPGEGAEPSAQLLDTSEATAIFAAWPAYTGRLDTTPVENTAVREIERPYFASSILLDKSGLSERFLRGHTPTIDGADRLLRLETMHVRLPRGYSPRNPAGLLVWIDASDKGPPPQCVFDACDAANIVAVGIDNCGNIRPIANRYQLALDAVATALRKYHIDKRRVYISGISGGGRVSSIMAACFPDVFAGAVPIVGLSCYSPVPVPGKGTFAPAFAKPPDKMLALWRKHRIGAITGGKDFNQGEIQAAAQLLRADGFQVKTFETVELGHELPKPKLFTEALTWVDEPYQKMRAEEVEQAQRALKAAQTKVGDHKALTDSDRAALMRVTEVGPWTGAAWEAVKILDEPPAK